MNTRRRSAKTEPVAVQPAPDYSKVELADGWGIDFSRPDFYHAGSPRSFGTPQRGGKYPCSVRVVERYEKSHSKVFAFVEHPELGLIAVTREEFEALELVEVVIRE